MKKIEKLEIWREDNEQTQAMWKNLNRGEQKVIWQYITQTDEYDAPYYLVDEIVLTDTWSEDMEQAVKFLKELGFTKFIFADKSTEALQSIVNLINLGCKITSTVEYKKDRWTPSETYTGLVVEL